MMIRHGTLSRGTGHALILAGPIFFAALGFADYCRNISQPIDITIGGELVTQGLFALILVMVGGILVSGLPILIGVSAMAVLGRHFAMARSRATWWTIGTLMGLAIAFATWLTMPFGETTTNVAFALTATSTLCAALCRHWVEWEEEEAAAPRFERYAVSRI